MGEQRKAAGAMRELWAEKEVVLMPLASRCRLMVCIKISVKAEPSVEVCSA